MNASGSKIDPSALYSTTGVLLGFAAALATGRTGIRLHQDRRFFVDDAFFLLAALTLVAGSVVLYLDIPLVYLQVDVSLGRVPAPDDFIQQLLLSVKLQNAAVVLLTITIFSVKFSYWFFFRSLLRRLHGLMTWSWCILPFLIIGAGFCISANFISCPVFDETIVEVCVTPSAVSRQSAVLKASTILDILTDVLLISIPVLLLWRVQISLLRKFALATILCLGFFMIVIAIIKVSTGTLADGQVDSPWVLFWFHTEASVGVIVVSISTFRAIFVRSGKAHERKDLNRNSVRRKAAKDPSPTTQTVLKSSACNGSTEGDVSNRPSETDFELQNSVLAVTHDFTAQRVRQPSYRPV